MRKPRARKSRRAEVLSRLREVEVFCAATGETEEHSFLQSFSHLLDDLVVVLEGASDPAVLLTVVATLARRRAELMLMRRVEAWRGASTV